MNVCLVNELESGDIVIDQPAVALKPTADAGRILFNSFDGRVVYLFISTGPDRKDVN